MKIYNEDKTIELIEEECDLSKGYLVLKQDIIHHEATEEIEEIGHYEVVMEYENGGQDVEWIVDTPGVSASEAWDEIDEYQIYYLYTENELEIKELEATIKNNQDILTATDFQAIKYAEGLYTEEQYKLIRDMRQSYRDEINKARHRIEFLQSEQKETQEK